MSVSINIWEPHNPWCWREISCIKLSFWWLLWDFYYFVFMGRFNKNSLSFVRLLQEIKKEKERNMHNSVHREWKSVLRVIKFKLCLGKKQRNWKHERNMKSNRIDGEGGHGKNVGNFTKCRSKEWMGWESVTSPQSRHQ